MNINLINEGDDIMVNWGILGAGNIAHRFASSLAFEKNSKLVAIALRNETKALEFKEKFDFERYYLDYEELLKDDKIDCVYIALPHGLHKKWAIKALQHGKAVLCEKPAALSALETKTIIEVAKDKRILFMEAMKSRFVPAYVEVKKRIKEGVIGDITHIDTVLCNKMPQDALKNSYHLEPHQGGVLLDTGIYCASWLDDFLGEGFSLKDIQSIIDPVDIYVNAELFNENGSGKIKIAFDRNLPKVATITGTLGKIEVYDLHRSQKYKLITFDGKEESIDVTYEHDDFYSQIKHFVDLYINNKKESDIMPLSASLNCAIILDTIRDGFSQ